VAALAVAATLVPLGIAVGQTHDLERRIWNLLDDAPLKKNGNPWRIVVEDVEKDLFVTHFTRLDGYRRMVWTTAHFDRNHWDPEDPMNSIEVFVANEYRAKNPGAEIRVLNFDPPMTHYGHLEPRRQLASRITASCAGSFGAINPCEALDQTI
jgi:hypothetical protein